jgi:hypothetical protein
MAALDEDSAAESLANLTGCGAKLGQGTDFMADEDFCFGQIGRHYCGERQQFMFERLDAGG